MDLKGIIILSVTWSIIIWIAIQIVPCEMPMRWLSQEQIAKCV